MNDETTEKPKRVTKVNVIALRKFFNEKGDEVAPGTECKISKVLAKRLQDNGVIKVAL
ncbi:MAG: hypothetical protein GY938_10885 [Ketobacter sp.]|nr:hypothetical protein [Ketobacter sp.]